MPGRSVRLSVLPEERPQRVSDQAEHDVVIVAKRLGLARAGLPSDGLQGRSIAFRVCPLMTFPRVDRLNQIER